VSDREWPKDYLQELERQIDLTPEVLSVIRFVDVEASSLFKQSYPIEVASAGIEMDVESMLIRPLPHWDDWSWESEQVHNISREMLERDGEDPRLVALRSNALLSGRYVVSDNPSYDNRWYLRMFVDTDVRMGFEAKDYDPLLAPAMKIAVRTMGPSDIARMEHKIGLVYQHTHRAGDDVRRMAAFIRYLIDPEWRSWFERADYGDLVRSLGRDPGAPRPQRK
jgi:hypothetical protein